MSPITVQNIIKSYGKKTVLNDVSFAINQGEIFGLVGLNGAGKTTLIKIILDLIDANGGNTSIFDIPSQSIEARKNLSYLPEKFQPSRYLRGFEYLELALSYYGKTLDEDRARAQAAALDLDPNVLDQRVGSYSKGMGQKIGLAGSFLIDPPLQLLDEPMSGLDPRARIKLKNELLRVKHEGKSIFFSSHILSDIDEICDRIGVIHEGVLFFIGTPAEFKAKYGHSSLEQCFLNAIDAPTAKAA